MADDLDDARNYDALDPPSDDVTGDGIEILRAAIFDGALFVTARRAFNDPAVWGEVLADMARRLALLYSAEGEFSEDEVLGAIESAFATDLGAPPADAAPKRRAKKAKAKRAAKARPAKVRPAKVKVKAKTAPRKPPRAKSASPARTAAKKKR